MTRCSTPHCAAPRCRTLFCCLGAVQASSEDTITVVFAIQLTDPTDTVIAEVGSTARVPTLVPVQSPPQCCSSMLVYLA